MTIFFQSHEITIYRLRRRTGTNRFALSATLTSYKADIQPSSIERAQMADGRFGGVYEAYVDPMVDIKENDRVVTTTKMYTVKGVTTWDGAGLLSHKQLILVSEDGNTS